MAVPKPPNWNLQGALPKPSEAMTHQELLDQIIRTTLKPVHATDANILRFISNYILCNDVRQAAKMSSLYYIDGKRLIERKDIYECIQKIAQLNSRVYGYDAAEVVERVKEILQVDPLELFDVDNGRYKESLDEIAPEIRRAIKKLHVMNVYEKDANGIVIGISAKIIRYEFWDKLRAAELLGQEKNVFKKKLDVTHDVGVNMRESLLGRLEDADKAKLLNARDVVSTDE